MASPEWDMSEKRLNDLKEFKSMDLGLDGFSSFRNPHFCREIHPFEYLGDTEGSSDPYSFATIPCPKVPFVPKKTCIYDRIGEPFSQPSLLRLPRHPHLPPHPLSHAHNPSLQIPLPRLSHPPLQLPDRPPVLLVLPLQNEERHAGGCGTGMRRHVINENSQNTLRSRAKSLVTEGGEYHFPR